MSVLATPVRPAPSPTKVVAVNIPQLILPLGYMVAPVPTLNLLLLPSIVTEPLPIVKIPIIRVSPVSYTHLTLPTKRIV